MYAKIAKLLKYTYKKILNCESSFRRLTLLEWLADARARQLYVNASAVLRNAKPWLTLRVQYWCGARCPAHLRIICKCKKRSTRDAIMVKIFSQGCSQKIGCILCDVKFYATVRHIFDFQFPTPSSLLFSEKNCILSFINPIRYKKENFGRFSNFWSVNKILDKMRLVSRIN